MVKYFGRPNVIPVSFLIKYVFIELMIGLQIYRTCPHFEDLTASDFTKLERTTNSISMSATIINKLELSTLKPQTCSKRTRHRCSRENRAPLSSWIQGSFRNFLTMNLNCCNLYQEWQIVEIVAYFHAIRLAIHIHHCRPNPSHNCPLSVSLGGGIFYG
jgi:hypothetical protein